jgi:hypothetical protein
MLGLQIKNLDTNSLIPSSPIKCIKVYKIMFNLRKNTTFKDTRQVITILPNKTINNNNQMKCTSIKVKDKGTVRNSQEAVKQTLNLNEKCSFQLMNI